MTPCQPPTPTLATWAGFALLCVGLFMAVLDVQIVATALPSIQRSLHVGPEAMSWVQTVYLTAEVVAIPLSGLLTRALSLRWLAALAIGAFTVASFGCALAPQFGLLLVMRALQGFFGGLIIPITFSAIFMLFPPRAEALATTLAGVLAVMAPALGPGIGGWITQAHSWHYLFLINIIPGIAATLGIARLLPKMTTDVQLLRHVDCPGLLMLSAALASLEIGLKLAPDDGWLSVPVIVLLALAAALMAMFARRCVRRAMPAVCLNVLADRRVALGCYLNFTLGFGLFGASYLIPVFLALVRGHDALQIGQVLLVTGCAQVVTAPLAVLLEKRFAPLLVGLLGFGLFGVGLMMSGFETPQTDFYTMIWPQLVRGTAIMLCILPATRLALGHLPLDEVPNASGLFNLTRNLGGALGLALIDTIIYGQGPRLASGIEQALRAGDVPTARALGLPIDDFLAMHNQPIDGDTRALLEPLVRHLALTRAINEAWWVLGGITLAALVVTALWALRYRKTALANASPCPLTLD